MARKTASYVGLTPASVKASAAARGSSRKAGTKPELLLRAALGRIGIRCSVARSKLTGRPDLVFVRKRVVVFVDGDYWHGRNWRARKEKLLRGNNATYWIAKIEGNRRRDKRTNRTLRKEGWTVLRFWETDISRDPYAVVRRLAVVLSKEHLVDPCI